MSLGYKQTEAAIAKTLEIKPGGIGALRARLRHLRSLGLLKLPTPGSGQRIGYSEDNAFVMLLALELEDVGLAPRFAATIAPSIARMHRSLHRAVELSADGDLYAAVTPRGAKRWTALPTRAAFDEFLARERLGFCLLNVSLCARTLNRALRDAEAKV